MPGFGDDVDDRAAVVAIFGRQAVIHEFEFLKGLDGGLVLGVGRAALAAFGVGGQSAVDPDLRRGVALPVRGEDRSPEHADAPARHFRDSRSEVRQPRDITVKEGHLDDVPIRHFAAECRRRSLSREVGFSERMSLWWPNHIGEGRSKNICFLNTPDRDPRSRQVSNLQTPRREGFLNGSETPRRPSRPIPLAPWRLRARKAPEPGEWPL